MRYRCFALLVIAILIPMNANAAKTITEEDKRVIAEELSKINEGLPKMVDKATRWESTVLAGTTVSYVFTLLNLTKENAPENIGFLLYRQALNGYCTAGGYVSHMRDHEVDLSLYYRDVEGNILSSLMIEYGDCPEEDAEEDTIGKEPTSGDSIDVDPEWLSLSERLFADTIQIWPSADNPNERLLGKWQNDEAPVIYQFLANGDAHQIEGNKIKLLNYSVAEINKEKRIMLLKINQDTDSGYDLYIQFYLVDQEARVAIVRDGEKTFEKWTYAGGPDLIAIAKQYADGKRPWISRSHLLTSDQYKRLDDRDRSTARENWKELFGSNKNN
ncbi:MAG: hypothetical protein ACR2PB_01075 [Desulfocapsaceae bacterium]